MRSSLHLTRAGVVGLLVALAGPGAAQAAPQPTTAAKLELTAVVDSGMAVRSINKSAARTRKLISAAQGNLSHAAAVTVQLEASSAAQANGVADRATVAFSHAVTRSATATAKLVHSSSLAVKTAARNALSQDVALESQVAGALSHASSSNVASGNADGNGNGAGGDVSMSGTGNGLGGSFRGSISLSSRSANGTDSAAGGADSRQSSVEATTQATLLLGQLAASADTTGQSGV